MDQKLAEDSKEFSCSTCKAKVGQTCNTKDGRPHLRRQEKVYRKWLREGSR